MRLRHVLATTVLLAVAALPGATAAQAASAPPVPPKSDCPGSGNPTDPQKTVPWYSTQLNFIGLSQINQGLYTSSGEFDGQRFAAGDPVTVAVIDSGLNTKDADRTPNPVFEGADVVRTHQVRLWQYFDCVGHGTAVASLIIGQPGRSRLVGIAPRVHLVPIQYTNTDDTRNAGDLAAALKYAIRRHPRVINMSLQLSNPPDRAIMRLLGLAEQDGIVVVAAGGNDNGQGNRPVYPAALSKTMDNIIAVSATGQDGIAAGFSVSGSYMNVAAPGEKVPVAVSYGGATTMDGTSFAAPLVTGTVALLLATHPDMTPLQVRNRLESTAVAPPGTRPNARYGWGSIDPLQAITSNGDDVVAPTSRKPGPPLAAPRPAAAPDRTLEHRALAIAVILLGLAALTVTAAAVLRGSRRARARRT